jgi:hypothetical protein
VYRACNHIRNGLDLDDVRSALLADSGVGRLREVIGKELGNRSALIKLDRELSAITAEIARCRSAALRRKSDPPGQLLQVGELISKIRRRQHGFAELGLLSDHYAGRLPLTSDEVGELCRLTGQHGPAVAARLGRDDSVSPTELTAAAIALADSWTRRYAKASDRRKARAAYVMRRSYCQLARTLKEADLAVSGQFADRLGPS